MSTATRKADGAVVAAAGDAEVVSVDAGVGDCFGTPVATVCPALVQELHWSATSLASTRQL